MLCDLNFFQKLLNSSVLWYVSLHTDSWSTEKHMVLVSMSQWGWAAHNCDRCLCSVFALHSLTAVKHHNLNSAAIIPSDSSLNNN